MKQEPHLTSFFAPYCLSCNVNVSFFFIITEMTTPNEDNGSIGFTLDEKPVQSVEIQEESEEQGRDRWSRKIEFLFACIGFCVGYGNIWRFPYMCFKNGGGMGDQSIDRYINQSSKHSVNQSINLLITQSVSQPSTHPPQPRSQGL